MTTKGQVRLDDLNAVWSYVNHMSVNLAKNFFTRGEGTYGSIHNFGYPGEALERFVERETFLSLIDVRSLAVAACITSEYEFEFYQGQKEKFGDLLSSTNEMKEDGILQSLAAYWNHVVVERALENDFISLLTTNTEKLAVIELLLSMPEVEKVRGIILEILSVIDPISLNALNPYQKTDELKTFALIYEFLRPKKSECKAFLSIYDISIKAWRLSKKELKFESVEASNSDEIKELESVLGCNATDLLSIHYELFTWERDWAKVAEVAKERVFDAWLKAGLTSNTPITADFKSRLDSSFFSSKGVSLKISQWFHEMKCDENILFIQDYSDNFSEFTTTPSLLSKLNHWIFTKKNGLKYINESINYAYYVDFMCNAENNGFDKKTLLHLIEKKRLDWGVTNDNGYREHNIAKEYLADLISEEIYPMKTYAEWKEIGLHHSFINHLSILRTIDPDLYVTSLVDIPVESRDFLIKDVRHSYAQLDFESDVFNETTYKDLYLSLLMESLYHFNPYSYGKTLYKFYKDKVLEEAGLTEEEINQLLKLALDTSLFENNMKDAIAEKFMNSDEKLMKEVDKTIGRIKNASYLSSFRNILDVSNEVLANLKVQDALVDTFNNMETSRYGNSLNDVYEFINRLKTNEVILASTTEKLFERFNHLVIENSDYKKNDINYLQYITNVLVTHYQNEDTQKENELCQTAM